MTSDTLSYPLSVRGNKKLPETGMWNILIRGTNWIGDAVMTLPALTSIRKTFPHTRIAVLAKPWVADVYRLHPAVDDIMIFESPGRHDGIMGKFRLAHDLRQKRFDAVILLQNAIEAAIIAGLACIPVRAGYDTDARGWLLTHAVHRTGAIKKIHQTHYYLEMVKALGCAAVETDVRLVPGPERAKRAEAILGPYDLGQKPLIGMAPGATYGAAKKWFPDRFAAVADRLTDHFSAQVLLFGSAADRESTGRIQQGMHHVPIDFAGRTALQEAMALMARCKIFISNDSGLMHVAAALGVPTIAIFGSTNPVTTGPIGSQSIIIRKEVSCSPCLKATCPKDFRCMDLIGEDDVYQAAERIMAT